MVFFSVPLLVLFYQSWETNSKYEFSFVCFRTLYMRRSLCNTNKSLRGEVLLPELSEAPFKSTMWIFPLAVILQFKFSPLFHH